jgi:hypothetical protein
MSHFQRKGIAKGLDIKVLNYISSYKCYFVSKIVLTYCEKNCFRDHEKIRE